MSEDLFSSRLVDYIDGRLRGEELLSVENHLQECDGCAHWVEAHRLLMGAESCAEKAPADLVARFALAPGSLDDDEVRALEAHMSRCAACREDLELVRAGVWRSSPVSDGASWPRNAAAKRLAVAAGVILVASALVAAALVRRHPSSPSELVARGSIVGNQTLENEGSLLIVSTSVSDGASLEVRAGRSVAFGSGFSVGSSASMVVATSERRKRDG